MTSKHKSGNYINGSWRNVAQEFIFESRNPAKTGEVLSRFSEPKEEEIEEAVEAAREAFASWRKLGVVRRAEYLWNVARRIEDQKEELAVIVAKESGKQINEARADVNEGFHMAQFGFAVGHVGEIGRVLGDEVATKLCLEILEPRGIVVSIAPWNFPFAIPLWLTMLPLVYGNTVILKPSEETPLCGAKIAELFHEAGIPKGVFQVLQGKGERIGAKLVSHPDTNVVLFTGSYEVGKKIKEEVAKFDNKICTVETGSKSGVIVLKDADLEKAVKDAVASAFKTAGQRCVTGGRIIVERPIFEEFKKRFVELARRVKVGDPLDPETYFGPMISKEGVEKGLRFNQIARDEGFEILLDRNDEPLPTPDGHWLRPFVYTGEWRQDSVALTQEAFSPHVALIPANDAKDAVRIYNDTDTGLAASVITGSVQKAIQTLLELECGVTYANLPCIGAGVRMSFGGRKRSGNLISSASALMPVLTHKKSITINYGDETVMAQGLDINIKN